MKKEYIAPDLYFESFVLSQSIASGCGSLGIATVQGAMADEENKYFTANTPSNYLDYECANDGTSIWEGFCYTAGGSNQLFLS